MGLLMDTGDASQGICPPESPTQPGQHHSTHRVVALVI